MIRAKSAMDRYLSDEIQLKIKELTFCGFMTDFSPPFFDRSPSEVQAFGEVNTIFSEYFIS